MFCFNFIFFISFNVSFSFFIDCCLETIYQRESFLKVTSNKFKKKKSVKASLGNLWQQILQN